MSHNGKTFTVGGTHLTVAPSLDGRVRISVTHQGQGASALLDEDAAREFSATFGEVSQSVFDGESPAPGTADGDQRHG